MKYILLTALQTSVRAKTKTMFKIENHENLPLVVLRNPTKIMAGMQILISEKDFKKLFMGESF